MARIRTIKPEFWQNEQLARLTEHARLLAIALLNHADDAGYFKANAYLVRAACFPFDDDSTKVLGSLQELSSIGFIEVRNDHEKQIGHVCKFREHQRIDKPGASKLQEAFNTISPQNTGHESNSTNTLGAFPEDSESTQRLEQGTGNREQGNGTGNLSSVATATKSNVEEIKSKLLRVGREQCDEVVSIWNATRGVNQIRSLTDERYRKLRSRLDDPAWPWREAIARLPIPGDGWQPDFDWLLKNATNAVSIVEGKFDFRANMNTKKVSYDSRNQRTKPVWSTGQHGSLSG